MAITTYITVLADAIIDGATKASPSWLPWRKPNRCSGMCRQWGIVVLAWPLPPLGLVFPEPVTLPVLRQPLLRVSGNAWRKQRKEGKNRLSRKFQDVRNIIASSTWCLPRCPDKNLDRGRWRVISRDGFWGVSFQGMKWGNWGKG